MNSRQVKNIVMEFWNEGIAGREELEIKSRDTVMRAVLDLDLVGKVQCVKSEGKLFLINLTLMEQKSV
jgi:hypothetical protein